MVCILQTWKLGNGVKKTKLSMDFSLLLEEGSVDICISNKSWKSWYKEHTCLKLIANQLSRSNLLF